MICPHCEEHLTDHDPVTGPTSITPTPGDAAMCFECGEVAVYDHDPSGVLMLRTPTVPELAEIHSHPGTQAARSAWAAYPDDLNTAMTQARNTARGQ